jgi:hypothetical protein
LFEFQGALVNPHFSHFFGGLDAANSGLRDFDNVDLRRGAKNFLKNLKQKDLEPAQNLASDARKYRLI